MLKNKIAIAITVVALLNCLRLLWDNLKFVLLTSFDTGWIIRTGQYVMLTYGAPYQDCFSWTNSGRLFIAYQWLAELFAAWIYSVGGLWAVGLCFAVISGFTYLFVLPAIWMRRGIPPAIPYLVLTLVLSPHWFNIRPQIFSYFFILAFIALLEYYRTTGHKNRLWLLVALTALWANIHLFWSVGLLLIVVYLFCDMWRKRTEKKTSPLILVLALALACVNLNPYGPQLFHYLWSFIDKSQYMGMNEVKPLWNMPTGGYIMAFLVLAWQAIFRKRKEMPIESFIVCLGATIAAVAVRRYGSLAVVLIWPYMALALQSIDWKQYTWAPRLTIRAQTVIAAVSLLIPALMWRIGCGSEMSARNVYTENAFSSVDFVGHYLTKQDHVFNDPPIGDWLILLTDVPVYIDTRYDMYPKVFCEDAFSCLWAAPKTLEYIKGHGATHIFVQNEFEPINKLLDASKDWTLIIDDGRVSFWGLNTEAEKERLVSKNLTDEKLANSGLPSKTIEKTLARRHKIEQKND